MNLQTTINYLILNIITSFVCLNTSLGQNTLFYNSPAIPGTEILTKTLEKKFVQESLPIGNGRLGAMFNGGIGTEIIVVNDITLWTSTKRGQSEVAQSGTRMGVGKDLETVREAYRQGKYGTKPGSMEEMSTKYLVSKEKLGNYSTFTEVYIKTGHNAEKAKNYRRELDIKKSIGSVSYTIDNTKYTREYFCSYPNDAIAMRYKAENGKLKLNIGTTTRHIVETLKAQNNQITLHGKYRLKNEEGGFSQIIKIDAGNGKITSNENNTLEVSETDEVIIYLAGCTDYLPIYPTFKGKDYKKEVNETISQLVLSLIHI